MAGRLRHIHGDRGIKLWWIWSYIARAGKATLNLLCSETFNSLSVQNILLLFALFSFQPAKNCPWLKVEITPTLFQFWLNLRKHLIQISLKHFLCALRPQTFRLRETLGAFFWYFFCVFLFWRIQRDRKPVLFESARDNRRLWRLQTLLTLESRAWRLCREKIFKSS